MVESTRQADLKKRMAMMLIVLGVLFGGIFGYKLIAAMINKHYLAKMGVSTVTVSTMQADTQIWQSQLNVTGSLRAINGINVTTELAGMVEKINFNPGAFAKRGDLLLQLNAASEIGLLQSLQAQAKLAQITYDRDRKQYAIKAVSKQNLDADFENVKNLQGQVAEQVATVAKKSVRAPFAGRLGINHVYVGQYLNPGDAIVSLQTLDPIYVDFYTPQQTLTQLELGQAVTVTSNAYPHLTFTGKITTINPNVDTSTRNIEVEATIANTQFKLVPGMFMSVTIATRRAQPFLTLPQTALSYNPYGDIVYLVQQGKDEQGKPILVAEQSFVTIGEIRGDQVQILKGLKKGDVVVTSGQLKLKNGTHILVNNAVMPSNSPNAQAPNNH